MYITVTARNVRLTHMTSVRDIRVRYHGTEDKEVMNLSRGAGSEYDPFVQVTKDVQTKLKWQMKRSFKDASCGSE
jgi:hypothetical protein